MKNNKSEQEKKLNKKAFISEFKNQTKAKSDIFDIIGIIIGVLLSGAVVKQLSIDIWLFNFAITCFIIVLMIFLVRFISRLYNARSATRR
jgi:uncharacterized protein YacL